MTAALPPGPRGLEAYGFLGRGNAARAFAFLERTAKQYGPISSFRILHQRICLVDDADLIRDILVTNQRMFLRDTGATLLRELVGDGLLTSEEPRHLERRRVLQPAFHRAQVTSYAEIMVAESESLSRQWRDAAEVDIGFEMKRLTLSIVGSALFGIDFGSDADRVARILAGAIRRSARLSLLLVAAEPLLAAYRRWKPRGRSMFFHSERQELEHIIQPILEKRRTAAGREVLSLLLASGELTEEDVRNEIVTLVLAGHETTATALTWAWYLVATHPRVEARLASEIRDVLGEREPALDDVPRLPYTTMVFNEALRLYPPALAFGRRPVEDITLGGYRVPRMTSILLSPYITHRNARYFDRPADFIPERWESMDAPKFAYFPFGGGSKMCIGESFARMEGVLILASLLRKWRLRYEGLAGVGVDPGITLGPDRKIMMRIEAREAAVGAPLPRSDPGGPGAPNGRSYRR